MRLEPELLRGFRSAVCSNGAMGAAPAETVSHDVLAGSLWECRWNDPDSGVDVAQMSLDDLSWIPATVPGTAAEALRELGRWSWVVLMSVMLVTCAKR